MSSLTAAAVLGVGALQVMDGTLTIGTLVAFQSLLMSFSAPIAQFVATASKIQQASADLARLEDVMHYGRDWRFPETPPAPIEAVAAGHLTLKEVSFGYSPLAPPLIENFSLDVAPGQWVALVGVGQRQDHDRQAHHRPRRAALRRDPHRRPHAAGMGPHAARECRGVGRPGDPPIQGHAQRQRHAVGRHRRTAPLLAALNDAGLADVVKNLAGNLEGAIDEGGRN